MPLAPTLMAMAVEPGKEAVVWIFTRAGTSPMRGMSLSRASAIELQRVQQGASQIRLSGVR